MPLSVNLTGVETKASALPPGMYLGAVDKAEEKTSQSGNPYVSWVFNIIEPDEFVGRKAFYNTSLLPQSLWVLKRLLSALGYEDDQLDGEIELELSDMIGVEATLVLVADEYKGETTSRVDRVLPAGSEESLVI